MIRRVARDLQGVTRTGLGLQVVEYQKRGLPHVHIAVRMGDEQPVTADVVDRNVRADLPTGNSPNDLWLNQMVQSTMIHKCTPACNKTGGACKFHFPKQAQAVTTVDDRGYVQYRRDTRSEFVVPYNEFLLRRYHCHINVEVAASVCIVAYLFKYVFKGADSATVSLTRRTGAQPAAAGQQGGGGQGGGGHGPGGGAPPAGVEQAGAGGGGAPQPEPPDALEEFMKVRYTSCTEAVWTFFGGHRCRMQPGVEELPIHAPGEDNVVVDAADDNVAERLDNVMSRIAKYFKRPLNGVKQTLGPAHGAYYSDVEPLRPHQDDEDNRDKERVVRLHPKHVVLCMCVCGVGEMGGCNRA